MKSKNNDTCKIWDQWDFRLQSYSLKVSILTSWKYNTTFMPFDKKNELHQNIAIIFNSGEKKIVFQHHICNVFQWPLIFKPNLVPDGATAELWTIMVKLLPITQSIEKWIFWKCWTCQHPMTRADVAVFLLKRNGGSTILTRKIIYIIFWLMNYCKFQWNMKLPHRGKFY